MPRWGRRCFLYAAAHAVGANIVRPRNLAAIACLPFIRRGGFHIRPKRVYRYRSVNFPPHGRGGALLRPQASRKCGGRGKRAKPLRPSLRSATSPHRGEAFFALRAGSAREWCVCRMVLFCSFFAKKEPKKFQIKLLFYANLTAHPLRIPHIYAIIAKMCISAHK